MGEYVKKYTGGIALMFSVLFLLIGLTKYEQIFSDFQNDTSNSIEYVKTAISQSNSLTPIEKSSFNIDGDGELMQTVETNDGLRTYHYRALSAPQIKGNYEVLPKLELEVIDGAEKKMIQVEIYKIDREKGLVYFLLKVEKNRQTVLTNTYTGFYNVHLVQ